MNEWASSALLDVVRLIATGVATSRAAVARSTGLARSTVSQHVDVLVRHGVVVERAGNTSVRGRPARSLEISRQLGAVAAICVDTASTRVAIATLTGTVVDQAVLATPSSVGPEELLTAATTVITSMVKSHGFGSNAVRQIVAGLAAPVDFAHGCAVRPPIMPGWDGYPVGNHLRETFGCPTVVDNDANLVAIGEASDDQVDTPLIAIKIGAGIGAGIVNADGHIHRGADGAAGDIGHIRIPGHDDVVCKCGNTGCLEAVTSYEAILDKLGITSDRNAPLDARAAVLMDLLASGDTKAIRAIRLAASEIGQVAAILVHAYNPRSLVLAGPLAHVRDELLAGVRAAVYERALPLATRKLTITTSQLGEDSEIRGAVALATSNIFTPSGLSRLLQLDTAGPGRESTH